MKTPDEIKKGLECCSEDEHCVNCPYLNVSGCGAKIAADALAYIKQLEANQPEEESNAED